ncbi:MAG: Type I signal peptidase [Candidatus Beckwithbacteria bacterium GW2011_GWA2_43_10]|uniref:Signal peptidase I n=1 Tax=Candidatus Beckwithbacteria bacterium GW2011_GWA2_43_10 TaxID=1618369 RepID=A0A0G1BZJ4_9BACT|nr:MAG: Type I signal peptidase [Candidatus Beckwithbacteria bacterium GW2011_GWA2_43_10]
MKKKFGYWLGLAFLATIAIFLMALILNLPNGFKLYTVQSGSMQPVIKIGSLVVSQKAADYKVGEVITFKNAPVPTTHRIQAIKDSIYTTKGDANDIADTEPVRQEQILGKVVLSLPYLGYPVRFVKTKEGFIGLIVIPATIIVYSEILNIKNEIIKLKKRRNEKNFS